MNTSFAEQLKQVEKKLSAKEVKDKKKRLQKKIKEGDPLDSDEESFAEEHNLRE